MGIDFVSDVTCPWCAIGFTALQQTLERLGDEAGLDVERARAVLESDEFGAEVREQERRWQALGIRSVPSVIVDGRHLIQGAQPVAVFEEALREIAAGRELA
jgi:predicted DsbA family dithiol-disulfide isomerase